MIRILHFTIPTGDADANTAVAAMERHIAKIQAGHRTLLDISFAVGAEEITVVMRCQGQRHWHTIGAGRAIMMALMRRSSLKHSTALLTAVESPMAPHGLTKETGRHWDNGSRWDHLKG